MQPCYATALSSSMCFILCVHQLSTIPPIIISSLTIVLDHEHMNFMGKRSALVDKKKNNIGKEEKRTMATALPDHHSTMIFLVGTENFYTHCCVLLITANRNRFISAKGELVIC